tara:strand:- start:1178 stop:1720 length:543 start_codon:yes stop_codon:yes gene_type:complete
MTRAMRDRLRRVAGGAPGRKKAKKPIAVRGKKTKKAKLMDQMRKRFRAITPAEIKGKGMSPGMKKAVTGSAVGMGGAGLLALARRIKPRGRLNAADLERVKKMMGKQKGGKMMTPEQLKKIMGTQPFKKPISPPGMKPVLDSKGNPVKNLFQKDDRPRRRQLRKVMQSPVPKGRLKRPKK